MATWGWEIEKTETKRVIKEHKRRRIERKGYYRVKNYKIKSWGNSPGAQVGLLLRVYLERP